jgi:hypothetical protein
LERILVDRRGKENRLRIKPLEEREWRKKKENVL